MVEQAATKRRFDSLQRLACMAITGAFKTTPTRALEALIDLPPFFINIKAEAMRAAYRLHQGGLWCDAEGGGACTNLVTDEAHPPI